MSERLWIDAVSRLRAAREAGVLVTVAEVRGHAPRKAGAKMVVSATGSWGTIGGGNLEAEMIQKARANLAAPGARAGHPLTPPRRSPPSRSYGWNPPSIQSRKS